MNKMEVYYMALPMVHLLAAYDWAQDKPELVSNPDYYCEIMIAVNEKK